MSPGVDPIMAYEALGKDDLEGIHAALSRRGNIRKTFSSPKLMTASGKASDASNSEEEEKKSTPPAARTSLEQKLKYKSGRSSEEDSDSRNSNFTDEERRRQRQRRVQRRKSSKDALAKIQRSDSAIEKLLEYNENANYSVGSTETFKRKSKSSMNPLLIGLSKSRDSTLDRKKRSSSRKRSKSRDGDRRSRSRDGTRGKSKSRDRTKSKDRTKSRERSSKSKERRRSKSYDKYESSSGTPKKSRDRSKSISMRRSKSGRILGENDDDPRKAKSVKRRASSTLLGLSSSSSHQKLDKFRGSSNVKDSRSVQSFRVSRSFMSNDEGKTEGELPKDPFEKLWGEKTKTVTRASLDNTNNSYQSVQSTKSAKSASSSGKSSISRRPSSNYRGGVPTSPITGKKTKLEKINELKVQVDVLEMELKTTTEERNQLEIDLNTSKDEVVQIRKLVEFHEGQSQTLGKRLAQAEEDLESTRIEQRTELTNFSDAAKELAKVNIEYAKSVDESRIIKEELSGLKAQLTEREEKIKMLELDLKTSSENVEGLEADVLYADDQIGKLEAEIKKLQDEVAFFNEAAKKDEAGETDGANHLREAQNEAEKRRFEQREKELEEKSRALEEKNRLLEEEMKEFERQKLEHLQAQQLKEKEFEEKRARDEEERAKREEELKNSDDDRVKKVDELNNLLSELKDENTALNGRLKSEQLESNMKLQNKENLISELEAEVSKLTEEKEKRDSAPDSSPSLIVEIETLKTEATRRHSDLESIQMKKTELEDEMTDLRKQNTESKQRVSDLESEIAEQKKECEHHRKRTLEWQKKTGEWSEKAVQWKQRAEQWEKKAREANSDNASNGSDDAAVDPQALFLAAAVQKKSANETAANANGSWRLGRRIFGMPAEGDDETQTLINKLEGENTLKENEIKNLKSEMVKMQTSYKEQAYSKTQACENLRKELEAIELKNTNLLKELELARKLNRTMAESDDL